MNTETTENANKGGDMKNEYVKYLIVGVVALVLLVGVWLFKSQSAEVVVPATALKCDSAFFNYVVAKPEIIVSASGVDTKATTTVSCQFNYASPTNTASVTTVPNGTPSAIAVSISPTGMESVSTVDGKLTDSAAGKSWRCSEPAKVFPKGKTNFSVTVTDDRGETSTCSSSIFIQ